MNFPINHNVNPKHILFDASTATTALELILGAGKGIEIALSVFHFNVGAAILATNAKGERRIISGCNIENAAYGSTMCAERTATFSAVKDGFRRLIAYAVVGGFDASMPRALRKASGATYITPCGNCRQVTNEFGAHHCMVILAREEGSVFITTLEYLLPAGFGPQALGVDAEDYQRSSKKTLR
ncbi:MAG: Cytidine deaminase [Parcubacteria group bacterium GW2011_GWA2_47_7]|nr:MAG: Cytidine deaminase [Parcubacteria group bacterium GW2011_GWA2_47_7]